MRKRKLEIAVISDVHLGADGCFANELLAYLNSIDPKTLILNGAIVDLCHFKKSSLPTAHLNVIKKIASLAYNGTEVYYIKGNHEDIPSSLEQISFQNITFCKKLVLNLNGKKTWFFHGAMLDIPFIDTKWMAKLGATGYKMLLLINRFVILIHEKKKQEKQSLLEKIEGNKARHARSVANFEHIVSFIAADNGYDCVICGHIHKPKKEQRETSRGNLLYLNSGDWVENRTALEYSFKRWKLYQYHNDKLIPFFVDVSLKEMHINQMVDHINSKTA